MKAILYVSPHRGGGGVEDARAGDVIIRPTTSMTPARVLVAGPGSNPSTLIVDGNSGNVSVRNMMHASILGGYGLTLSLPPGVDASNDLSQILSASNPYAWASNAVSQALFESDRAWTASEYASNALHSLSHIPDLLDAVVWTSNQAASYAADAADAGFARNVATMAYGLATHASNAANALSEQGNIASNALIEQASNIANNLQVQIEPTSNVAYGTQTALSNMSFVAYWASNAARDGAYASNVSRNYDAAVSNAVAKSTSAYLTATTAAGTANWASNASGIAMYDSKRALTQALAIGSNTAIPHVYASNAASFASNAIISVLNNTQLSISSNIHSVRMGLNYSCNVARTALSSALSASNAAFPASAIARTASSNAQSALDRAIDTVSASRGGSVLGNLNFANQASIVNLSALGVGTSLPEYPVQVMTTAPNSTVSMWLSGDIHTLSDRRDKQHLKRIDSALDRLLSIGGYTYSRDCGRAAGVIAQEVIKVMPEAVHTNATTGQLSVAYNCLIPLIIEAVRELSERSRHP